MTAMIFITTGCLKRDTMEDILISKTMEERDKEDDQVRYSFDDIKALAQKHITKQNFYQALYEYEVEITD